MSPINRWTCLTVCLLLLMAGCVENSPNILSASEATAGASGGAGKVTISWGQLMAESYDLFMATVPGGAKSGRKIPNVANPIQITDLTIGATYYFVLASKNNQRTSLRTGEITHTIQSPDDRLSFTFDDKTAEITLAWDPSEEASKYNIYWRNSPGVTRQNGIKISNVAPPHKLSGLIPGVTYYFVVTAIGKSGNESGVSKEISYQSDL